MNYNRRRNIFTLGDFQHQHPQQQIKAQLHRRQNSDPFERDPFKIQSYNFRYADRPSYPLQHLGNNNNSNNHSSAKRFETYFYNYDFAPTRNDKENPPTNKFHEFRRRKFLHDQQQQAPTSASMFSQAANSRQFGVRQQQQQYQQQQQQQPERQQSRQQPLYPLANASLAAANGGTTSSTSTAGLPSRMQPTATATSATRPAVAAAAATSHAGGNVAQSRGRSHSGQRLYGGHTTDASSASTAVGGFSVGTSNMSAFQANAAPLMPASSREYLSGVRTPHSPSAQTAAQVYGAPHALRQTRSSSRSSLGIGAAMDGARRHRTDALDGKGSGTGSLHKGVRELSGARASSSEHARRSPLQTLHSSPQNMVTNNAGQAQGSYSGCQININIKGLDSKQLGENVTIKIESDNNTNTNDAKEYAADGNKLPARNSGTHLHQHHLPPTNNLTGVPSSPSRTDPLNIMQQCSASTFNIDKRLSKFSLRGPDDDKQRDRARTLERKAHDKPRSISNTRPVTSPPVRATTIECEEAAQRKLHLQSQAQSQPKLPTVDLEERVPSRVPWRIDENLRKCFQYDEHEPSHNRPTNLMRRICTNYNAAKKDIANLKKYAAAMSAAPPPRPPGTCVKPSGGAGSPFERKLLNTTAPQSRFECGTKPPTLRSATPLRQQLSRNTLGPSLERKGSAVRSIASSYASASEVELKRGQPLIIQSRQNVKNTPPLNVNINVYADKLRLLRV